MFLKVFKKIQKSDGGLPCGAVEACVPLAQHVDVARAVFRTQNRCKDNLCRFYSFLMVVQPPWLGGCVSLMVCWQGRGGVFDRLEWEEIFLRGGLVRTSQRD